MYTFDNLKDIMARLRAKDGCPWDREQTHETLIRHLREESEEVVEAIENKDNDNLCEELGDLLFQIMSHSQIASEEGAFTIDDVVDGICTKMIRRHPHVFDEEMSSKEYTMEELNESWHKIKEMEKRSK